MIIVLAGLHGAGKSHLASYLASEFNWTVCTKRELLKLLHSSTGTDTDWVSWYRALYTSEGAYHVTKRLMNLLPSRNHIIVDSIHNLGEWEAIREWQADAILAYVTAPKTVRRTRNDPEDEPLDLQRIQFWHDNHGSCLMSESEWCFNGAAPPHVQRMEFEALLSFFNTTPQNVTALESKTFPIA